MYQALYRKYRPKDFDSVVGQNAIVKTLKNSIVHNNFSHAYMFFGPRGTGKTTVSKIFARNINCLNPIDGNACGKCDHCKCSFSKECIDIIEIDAASNNGVDEIRELRNKINIVPSELQYKVYIIDEVHMLSSGAFNALLKTLEEPPSHVVFILATTDPQKVPETIISRCQCFSFKRISSDIIFDHLKYVCKEEKIKIDDEVIHNIAVISEGGLRDALGFLDKLVSYTDKKITMDDFVEVNGTITDNDMSDLLNNILIGNISNVLSTLNSFDNNGKNIVQIMIQMLNYSHKKLVDYYSNTNDYHESYSVDLLQQFTVYLNEKIQDIKKSSNIRIYSELLLLKFINDYISDSKSESSLNNNSIINKDAESSNIGLNDKDNINSVSKDSSVEEVEEEADDKEFDFSQEYEDSDDIENDNNSFISNDFTPVDKTSDVPLILNIDEIMKVRVNNTLALANKDLLAEEKHKFDIFNDFTFDQEIGYIACSLLDANIRAVSPDIVLISYEYDSNVKQNLSNIHKLTDVYQKLTKSNKEIAIITDEEWNRLKNEYISNLKNGIKYEVLEEPSEVLEEAKKDDIIVNSAIDLFGDIVEVEED